MKFPDKLKGVLLAFVSVIAVSNVYIFSKAALMEVSLPQFGVYWFAFGLAWIILYGCFQKTYRSIKEFAKRQSGILLLLGVIEVIGTYFFLKLFTLSLILQSLLLSEMFPPHLLSYSDFSF